MAFLLLFEHLAIVYWGSELRSVPALFGSADWRVAGLVIGAAATRRAGLLDRVDLGPVAPARNARASAAACARSPRIPTPRCCSASTSTGSCRWCSWWPDCSPRFAGVVFALNYRQVHPFMGEVVGLKGISAMIVGGMGNIWGSIAGGLIIGLVEVLSIGYFGADFVDIVVYGLLLLILFVRPTGLFTGMHRRRGAAYERLSRRHPGAAGGQRRARLWRLSAARGRPAQSRARRLRGDRRLCVGLSQQRLHG